MSGLLVAQFLGAFNDNAWKLCVTLLAMAGLPAGGPEAQAAATQAMVAFMLPLVLCSLPGGWLADRCDRRRVLIALKGLELLLMLGAVAALALTPGGGPWVLVLLAGMGLQSALFGPAKYGILPDLVPHAALSRANGALEAATFVAIVFGTALGGMLLENAPAPWVMAAILAVLAAIGFVASLRIPALPVVTRPVGSSVRAGWRAVRGDRVLWLSVAGLTVFWGLASLLGQNMLVYAKADLLLSDTMAGVPMAAFGLGVGLGSVLAGRLSRGEVEIGLVPLGALTLSAGTLLLGLLAPGLYGTLALMALLGIGSGFVAVPLDAVLQWRAPVHARGAVIAIANVGSFAGALLGSLITQQLSGWLSTAGVLVAAAVLTMLATAWALWLLPTAALRAALMVLTRTIYRLRVVGRANVPASGGALLVPNHVSFVDGLLLIAAVDRPIRFVVDQEWYDQRLVRPFARALGAIPIAAKGGPRVILRALRDAGEWLDRGELVCIFAEGQISRTGALLPFRRGLERIVRGRSCPIVPVWLDRLWGSIFSRADGRFVWKLPRRVPYPVTLAFGSQLPATTPVAQVRRAVEGLAATAWDERRGDAERLEQPFLRAARRAPWRRLFADASGTTVTRGRALVGAIAFARALREPLAVQERWAALLPPSIGGALVSLAAALAGRTIVHLNYTAGPAGLASAARQAGLRRVVTSRTFLDKARIELPPDLEPVFLEDIKAALSRGARLRALLLALFVPARWLSRACGAPRTLSIDDVATVIFSSGSTGEPKGVELTHWQITSNAEGTAQVVPLRQGDRLLGILPLFHSFGYLSLWVALQNGLGIVFHPNPLDAVAVGELVHKHKVTVLLATPTFLQIYLRRCEPADFGSLRIVLAGAEKLPERLATAFVERFGIRPLEGYGATECAPVIAVSTLDFRAPGFFQAGSKRGHVGQPLPGIALRVVDPDTGAELPPDTPGMLLVRGPNVMRGYLGRPDLTAKALSDGWYVTGDIARLDEDGFLQITDRLSRFSKIGGEMVPHGRVEEALHEAAGASTQVFAVTAVPDDRKGERLAVLHTLPLARIPEVLGKLAQSGLPNLFVPRADAFVAVEALPMLGTGKLDLRAIKQQAQAALVPANG
ncbi:MAG: MFS transporter [Planctomycetes bacterium]|nr:MFS transporter [Planctomycetota bacterium]